MKKFFLMIMGMVTALSVQATEKALGFLHLGRCIVH